jgi:hypothetical protein
MLSKRQIYVIIRYLQNIEDGKKMIDKDSQYGDDLQEVIDVISEVLEIIGLSQSNDNDETIQMCLLIKKVINENKDSIIDGSFTDSMIEIPELNNYDVFVESIETERVSRIYRHRISAFDERQAEQLYDYEVNDKGWYSAYDGVHTETETLDSWDMETEILKVEETK